jgi:SAM-dependent methyltransferase
MDKNIKYQTPEISRYFSENRVTWPQFYRSERVVIEQLGLGTVHQVLDIGCGCGGLGLALREKFGVTQYTGVEINLAAAQAAIGLNPNARIINGDILEVGRTKLLGQYFDAVFSLSCVDWNVRFQDMLLAAWTYVKPGGYLVSTFRLSDGEGCLDFDKSYQFINFEGVLEGERAAYVVLNYHSLLQQLGAFNPLEINAFGYWGAPSASAVTPYQQLCFAAFTIRKRHDSEICPMRLNLDLPKEILDSLDRKLQ